MSRRDAKKQLLAFETKVYNPAMAWIRDEQVSYTRHLEKELRWPHRLLMTSASVAQETGSVDADPVLRDPE